VLDPRPRTRILPLALRLSSYSVTTSKHRQGATPEGAQYVGNGPSGQRGGRGGSQREAGKAAASYATVGRRKKPGAILADSMYGKTRKRMRLSEGAACEMPIYGGLPAGGDFAAPSEYLTRAETAAEAAHCLLGSLERLPRKSPSVERGHFIEELGIIEKAMREPGSQYIHQLERDPAKARRTFEEIAKTAPRLKDAAERYLSQYRKWFPEDRDVTAAIGACYVFVVALCDGLLTSAKYWGEALDKGEEFKAYWSAYRSRAVIKAIKDLRKKMDPVIERGAPTKADRIRYLRREAERELERERALAAAPPRKLPPLTGDPVTDIGRLLGWESNMKMPRGVVLVEGEYTREYAAMYQHALDSLPSVDPAFRSSIKWALENRRQDLLANGATSWRPQGRWPERLWVAAKQQGTPNRSDGYVVQTPSGAFIVNAPGFRSKPHQFVLQLGGKLVYKALIARGVLDKATGRLTESDAEIRTAERRWQASNNAGDLERWLLLRFRSGETDITVDGPRGGMQLILAPRKQVHVGKEFKAMLALPKDKRPPLRIQDLGLRYLEDAGIRTRFWHTRPSGATEPGGKAGWDSTPAKFDIGLRNAVKTFVTYNRSPEEEKAEEDEYWRTRRNEAIAEAKKAPKVVEAAVEAWRLYLGSIGYVRPEQEERLTTRAQKTVSKAATAMGVPFVAMQTAVDREARKRGVRLPRVGQDI